MLNIINKIKRLINTPTSNSILINKLLKQRRKTTNEEITAAKLELMCVKRGIFDDEHIKPIFTKRNQLAFELGMIENELDMALMKLR